MPARWTLAIKASAKIQMLAEGTNYGDHEYAIEQDGVKVAEVSGRWFRVRDT